MKRIIFCMTFCFSFSALLFVSKPAYTQTLNPVLPDLVINNYSGDIIPKKINPCIFSNRKGKSAAAWIDMRELKPAIYAQVFDEDGALAGPNVKLTGDSLFDGIRFPAGAMDSAGNFVVTWMGIKSTPYSQCNVYFRRFSSDGSPASQTMLVANSSGFMNQYPDIALAPDGDFVIVWEDHICDLRAQRFGKDGTPIESSFRVSDDATEDVLREVPSISSDSQGNFVITWFDTRGPSLGLYAQLFSNNGERLGPNFKINDNFAVPTWTDKDVSFDRSGHFIVVWTGADYHVYGQRFDKYRQRTTAQNFEVASEDMSSQKDLTQLGVAASDSGNFMVTWPWDPTDLSDRTICARLFNDDSSPAGDPFILRSGDDAGSHNYPGVTSAGNGNFLFTWTEGDSFLHDIYYDNIYAQKFSKKGEPLDTPVKINDGSLSCADQTHPSLILNQNGEFTVAWQDDRNGNPDIYVQKFSADGTPADTPYTVGNDILDENYAPEIARSPSGNYVVAWLDRGMPGWDWNVYVRCFTADGRPQGEILKVNEQGSQIYFTHASLSVAMDSLDNFIVTWSQPFDSYRNKVIGQRFTNAGERLGSNFTVNTDQTTSDQLFPSVAIWPDGQSIITWMSTGEENYAIYAQLYASDGQKKGDKFQISRTEGRYGSYFPGLDITASGDLLICWHEYDRQDSTMNLVFRRFSKAGTPMDSLIRVSGEPAYFIYSEMRKPAIASNKDGNFVIAWGSNDYYDETLDMFGQRFAADGTPVGKNFRIATGRNRAPHSPDVKLQGKNIYCVWQDNQGTPSGFNTGYDIMANVLDFDTPVGIDGKEPISVSGSFALDQNFPNPFNPSTTLAYRLARSVKVQLAIFDLLGRKIRVLLDNRQAAGYYEVLWDGNDDRGIPVASGVYIYRLKAGNYSKSHKMILIR